MKAKNILGLAVAALLISGMTASNAMAVSGTASAEVVVPVTIAPGAAALSFGSFVPNTGGNVDVTTAGATTAGGAVQQLNPGSQGTFNVAGDVTRTVSVTMDSSVSLSGPGGTISATLVNDALPANPLPAIISVGGNLTVPASLAPGSYLGSFAITADY